MTTPVRLSAVAFLVLVGWSGEAFADMVQLTPSKDNALYEDLSGSTSNGQGQHFFVGRTNGGAVRRGLIAFDVASNIPAGSTIQGVTLELHVSRVAAGAAEVEIDLHAALADWGEGTSMAAGEEGMGAPAAPGDATWLNTFYPSQLWTAPGGDFLPNITSSAAVSDIGFYTFDSMYDTGLISDVQQWLDSPSTNFGWGVMLGDESIAASAKRFDARENSAPAFQPVLTVTYAPADE
ncbi:MAG TPA: DNRLRE domain-containing protein [Myxococcaceae bacterium]|nr:DNRLRE domain-containing protein [Myxococcaceae bacterium]